MNTELLNQLKRYEEKRAAFSYLGGVTYFDGNTVAPKKSSEKRAKAMAELSRLEYEITSSSETINMIESLKAERDDFDDITKRKIDILVRNYEETKAVPKEEYVAYSELCSTANDVWHEAKVKNDFAMFEPYLEKMFEMTKKIALYRDQNMDPYDKMLDTFERGLTSKDCDEFFACLRERLVPLIPKIAKKYEGTDRSFVKSKSYPLDKQREFSKYLMNLIGMDHERSMIGETEHPFTDGFGHGDVRITTHYDEFLPLDSMFSVIHEGGHALYEMGINEEFDGTSLFGGVSMGIHESQSRFFENIIGRSKEFCNLIYPYFRKKFAPNVDNVTKDEFYNAVTYVSPSLVRTSADEVTYCVHIMIRYELEKKLFNGDIKVHDLPKEWNRLYKEYLGVDVPSDREGVLQDSHWAFGAIGYFPSYAIGSAYGAQFLEEMKKDFNPFEDVSKGDFSRINNWLGDKIWKYGSLIDPKPLFESVCGKFDPNVFVDYIEKKYLG